MSDEPHKWAEIVFSTEPNADRAPDRLRIRPLSCGILETRRPEKRVFAEVEFAGVWLHWKTTCDFVLDHFNDLATFIAACRQNRDEKYELIDFAAKVRIEFRWLPDHASVSITAIFPFDDRFRTWADENPSLLRHGSRARSTVEFWVSLAGLEEQDAKLRLFFQQYQELEQAVSEESQAEQ